MRWRQFKSATSNNKREAFSVRQYGGTATIAINVSASRVTCTGADETGLGRWSWLLLEGKNDVKVRIITAYNPCKTSHKRPATVYTQHRRYFLSKNNITCPRTQFRIDLCALIKRWQLKNNRIVLLIDMNENMSRSNGPLLQALTQDVGLIDPIQLRHHKLLPPVTQNRGSCQIDGILVSPELRNIVRGGWTAFGEGIGDHRAGFIDIKVNDIVGVQKLEIVSRNARRLTCDDPRTIKRYNEHLKKHAKEHDLISRARKLQEEASFPATVEQIQELNDLHKQRKKIAKEAEKKCRKFKSGAVAYAPNEIQNIAHEIHVWKLVVTRLSGRKVCSKVLQRAARKSGLDKPWLTTLENAKYLRNQAIKKYRKIKPTSKECRDRFYEQLVEAAEIAYDDKRARLLETKRHQEKIRKAHMEVRFALEKTQSN